MKPLDVSNGISREVFEEQIRKRVWTRPQTEKIEDLLIYEYTDWSNVSNPIVLRQQFIHLLTVCRFTGEEATSNVLLPTRNSTQD